MQIVMKSCSRMNFAARLSVRLFDEETHLTHNVSGCGKPKLHPKRVSFIKAKCFEMFPCRVTENILLNGVIVSQQLMSVQGD